MIIDHDNNKVAASDNLGRLSEEEASTLKDSVMCDTQLYRI